MRPLALRGSGRDEASLVGDHDELNAVACAELREDVGDVRLDRQRAQVEGVCDFAVVASSCDKVQYFELAGAELVESVRGSERPLFGLRDVGLDPAPSAPKTYSSSSNVVSTRTRVFLSVRSAVIWRVASRPSSSGIRMSIS